MAVELVGKFICDCCKQSLDIKVDEDTEQDSVIVKILKSKGWLIYLAPLTNDAPVSCDQTECQTYFWKSLETPRFLQKFSRIP